MTRADFDRAMPGEFWREVVDRVAEEAPDTLLLAEAFWLLEGYFVRTLGMHRVYNSAFMNMLRDERNAEYRQLIRSTLEFDPQILKRYVNFMSNPDERTAIDQFGGIDAVVNNAGIVSDRTLVNMTPDEFDDVIAVNLRGTWSVSRHAARAMRDQGHGLLLQVISGSAFVGSVGQTNYAASKAGVMGMLYSRLANP